MSQSPGLERLHIISLIRKKTPEEAAEAVLGLMKVDRGIARKEGYESGFKKALAATSRDRAKNKKQLKDHWDTRTG